jgi:hypothetical protein
LRWVEKQNGFDSHEKESSLVCRTVASQSVVL